VKALTRGLGLGVVTLGMLGVTGCGPDNEAEGQKLAKTAGDPGAPNPKAHAEDTLPPATTREEAGLRQKANQSFKKGGAYSPGTGGGTRNR